MLSQKRRRILAGLERKANLQFKEIELLNQALTHKSFSADILDHNERMEFLGDSVLGLVISDYIYQMYSQYEEGELSKLKGGVVSRSALAKRARALNMGKYLLLGKGEGGRTQSSILANAFEALIGALYIDSGLEAARSFILRELSGEVERVSQPRYVEDYKSLLQEWAQSKFKRKPGYHVIKAAGPEHKKRFTVRVCIDDQSLGLGRGRSKKEAEQQAAKRALAKLKRSKGCTSRP